jgi:hypothetical protein
MQMCSNVCYVCPYQFRVSNRKAMKPKFKETFRTAFHFIHLITEGTLHKHMLQYYPHIILGSKLNGTNVVSASKFRTAITYH